MKNCFSFLWVLFISTFLYAQKQHLTFQSISPEKGFSAPLVRGALQDKEGYLWFGATNGVFRYDGYTLKPYVYDPNKKKNITKGYVNVIYEDSHNNLWVGTGGGFNKLDRSTGEYEQYIPDPGGHIFKRYIWSILEDSKGTLWVGAMGLYTMDFKANKLIPVIFPKGMEKLNNVSFQTISEDQFGNLWFGTSIGLFKYIRKMEQFLPVRIDPDASKLTSKNWNTGNYSMPSAFTDKASGELWFGTFGGKMLKLDPSSSKITEFTLTDPQTSLPIAIQSIAEENKDQFWLGTYSGLILFDKKTGKILSHYRYDAENPFGLTDEQIITVLKDKSGTLWAATLVGGLNRVNRTFFPFSKIEKKARMKDRTNSLIPFQDFYVSKSGSLIYGTYDGVEEIKADLKTVVMHPPFKPINVLMEDSRGNQWIGLKQAGGGGIYIKNPQGNLQEIKDSLGNTFTKEVHCLFESSAHKIYFGTEFYLYEVDPLIKRAKMIFQTKARIFWLGEIDNGNLLVGTLLGGLYIYDPKKLTALKRFVNDDERDPTGLKDNSVIGIHKDSKGRIWLGASYGLTLFDPNSETFKIYDQQQGLDRSAVMSIVEDDNGKLWLGTGTGISMFDPENPIFRNFDFSYGMIEGYHYVLKKFGNRIFAKAQAGITYFSPNDVKLNPFIPSVKITEVKIFDKIIPFNDKMELTYDQNYISFEFAALSFISPERNNYAYKMDGIDKDWIHSKNRRYASYTSLKPGDYTFRVKASNNDGIWNNKETVLSFTVKPPWWQTYWAYTGYFLIFLILVYAWRKYDLKRQNLKYQLQTEHGISEKLQEISQMKSRFFTNISHEFRTPLTLIIGPADNIISGKEHDTVKEASMIKKNALRLLRLINQLLDVSKLDEGSMSLKVSKSDLVTFTRSILMIFESLAESKGINLNFQADKDSIHGYFDKEKFEKILINLISNAFKFSRKGGCITVTLSESQERAVIKVRDTGIGIPEKELPKLFNRFYQVDNSHTREYSGTGIGLSLTKELIELHRGTITVDSKIGEWTVFTVELPIGEKAFESAEIIEEVIEKPFDSQIKDSYLKAQLKADIEETGTGETKDSISTVAEHDDEQDEKMILLVVEDNADVRGYIKDGLGEEFIIEEASNGEEGVKKALAIIPDLIVSDIMMPKMDGYELSRILKNDDKTNHIPIILLTAKSDRESKFEGLETGVDDYLTKPFDKTELLLRIRNLIHIRKTLQEKFSGKEKLPVKEALKKLHPLDEKFMTTVNDVIGKHMAEEDFNIEEFGKEIGMSRTQLHRKLKALTGKSASRYIRSYRLSIAKEMIENQQGNISEVAYSVGFSSPVYFSRCFREEFGYAPSDLRETQNHEEVEIHENK